MITKKTFIRLAEEINFIEDAERRKDIAELLGGIFASVNPSFSWNKWNEACFSERRKKR